MELMQGMAILGFSCRLFRLLSLPLLVFHVLVLTPATQAKIIPNAYIVQVSESFDANEVAHGVKAFTRGNISHIYKSAIKGFAIQVPPGVGKAQILSRAGVIKVEPDLEIRLASQRIPTGIDRIDIDLNNTAKIDGIDERVDVDVAILDTGIDASHPDLNVFMGQNFADGSSNKWADDNGHGTHVSGTVAALDNNIGVVGVVPGARLWAVKVLNENGEGSLSFALAGVDWVTENADQIEVANMSLGSEGVNSIFHTAIQNSVDAGVVYVVAAGNDSQDILGADGVFDTGDDTIPAAYPQVATISALADADGLPGGTGGATSYGPDDSFASLSNFSATELPDNPVDSGAGGIDLIMPGIDILSTVPVGTGETTVNARWDGDDHQANEIIGSALGDANGLIFSCGLGDGIGEANTCPNTVADNIAHIRRGDITFADKVAHAESKGAVGVIISNNLPGNFLGTLGGSSPLVVVSVSQADGDELELISPEGTPGSVTVIVDDYDIFSGTSMASPHAAGLAALYIAEYGRATDANGVYDIRQKLIDSGISQVNTRGLAVSNDPDGLKERIGYYVPGDFDKDGFVDIFDLTILASSWLLSDFQAQYCQICNIDIPADNTIDLFDFEVLAQQWQISND